MYAIRKQGTTRSISLFLAFAVLMTIAPISFVLAAPASDGETATVLIFPVLDESESGIDDLGGNATRALRSAIDREEGLSASTYSPHSALVGRAVSEGRLREVDVEAGMTAAADLALFIGHVLEVDYVVLASVTTVELQEDEARAKVILSGQSYAVKENVDEASGSVVDEPKVETAFGVSGESIARVGYDGSMSPLVDEAVRAAAHKAAATLAGRAAGEVPETDRGGGKGFSKWLIPILLIGLLALGVSSANDDDPAAGPAEQAKPVTNLSLEQLQTNLRLTWDAPTGTTLDILRYEISRQVDGAGFSILPVTVGATEVGYTDTTTLTGTHNYQYRVRVLYTSGDASEYKYTGNLVFTR